MTKKGHFRDDKKGHFRERFDEKRALTKEQNAKEVL
jgi:hypothetical protein